MPDQLESIVQKMIEANEPEGQIGAVIQEYKKQHPTPAASTAPAHKPNFWDAHPVIASLARGVTGTLPYVGALGGGFIASPTLLGTVAGGAAGAGVGKAAEDYIEQRSGLTEPKSVLENTAGALGESAKTAAMGGAMTGLAFPGEATRAVARATGPSVEALGSHYILPSYMAFRGLLHGEAPDMARGAMGMLAQPYVRQMGQWLTRYGNTPANQAFVARAASALASAGEGEYEALLGRYAKEASTPEQRAFIEERQQTLTGNKQVADASAKAQAAKVKGYRDDFNAMRKANDYQTKADAVATRATEEAANAKAIADAKISLEPQSPVITSTQKAGDDTMTTRFTKPKPKEPTWEDVAAGKTKPVPSQRDEVEKALGTKLGPGRPEGQPLYPKPVINAPQPSEMPSEAMPEATPGVTVEKVGQEAYPKADRVPVPLNKEGKFSEHDLQALRDVGGANVPDVLIMQDPAKVSIPRAWAEHVIQQRALREGAQRTHAGMDAGFETALDKDQEMP